MSFVSKLNELYFRGNLSPEVIELLQPVDAERPEVQAFVDRMCRQMQNQHIGASDFAEDLAWRVGVLIPNILPGSWAGAVPPVTQKGRHAVIDEYLARNSWRPLADGDRLLDLGCGFPPVTVVDSARRFPNVQITGADPSFGRYLLREANGDYGLFDDDYRLIYFQAADGDRWERLYRDLEQTRRQFGSRLDALLSSLPGDDAEYGSVAQDDAELIRNPVVEFERDNVRFERLGIGSRALQGFTAVRCFNVLFYFDNSFRSSAFDWLRTVVVDGGICVSGVDGLSSRYARYSVHRAENGSMVPREFAFSLENIRPLELIPVFTLHEDDHDAGLMATLIRALRSDERFRSDIDRRLDELQAELGYCARKANGYLGPIDRSADAAVVNTAIDHIGAGLERDGFNERAAELLRKNGYRAWVNCVGHVAIDPATGPA